VEGGKLHVEAFILEEARFRCDEEGKGLDHRQDAELERAGGRPALGHTLFRKTRERDDKHSARQQKKRAFVWYCERPHFLLTHHRFSEDYHERERAIKGVGKGERKREGPMVPPSGLRDV